MMRNNNNLLISVEKKTERNREWRESGVKAREIEFLCIYIQRQCALETMQSENNSEKM